MEKAGLSEPDGNALMYLWYDTVLRHPFTWLKHRTNVFRQVIGLTHQELFSPVLMEPNSFSDWVATAYGHKNPELNHFQNYAKRLLTRLSSHLFFRPWIYLGLTTLLIVACFTFRTPQRIQIGLIAASGFAQEAGLLLCAPSADFRYSHYMIYTSVLAFLLFLQTLFNQKVIRKGAWRLFFNPSAPGRLWP